MLAKQQLIGKMGPSAVNCLNDRAVAVHKNDLSNIDEIVRTVRKELVNIVPKTLLRGDFPISWKDESNIRRITGRHFYSPVISVPYDTNLYYALKNHFELIGTVFVAPSDNGHMEFSTSCVILADDGIDALNPKAPPYNRRLFHE